MCELTGLILYDNCDWMSKTVKSAKLSASNRYL